MSMVGRFWTNNRSAPTAFGSASVRLAARGPGEDPGDLKGISGPSKGINESFRNCSIPFSDMETTERSGTRIMATIPPGALAPALRPETPRQGL